MCLTETQRETSAYSVSGENQGSQGSASKSLLFSGLLATLKVKWPSLKCAYFKANFVKSC